MDKSKAKALLDAAHSAAEEEDAKWTAAESRREFAGREEEQIAIARALPKWRWTAFIFGGVVGLSLALLLLGAVLVGALLLVPYLLIMVGTNLTGRRASASVASWIFWAVGANISLLLTLALYTATRILF